MDAANATIIYPMRGNPDDDWYFDGTRLSRCCPNRFSLTWDGTILEEPSGLGGGKWWLDGTSLLTNSSGMRVAWTLDAGALYSPGLREYWLVTPRSFIKRNGPPQTHWLASTDVPIVVFAYVSGILQL